MKYDTRGGYRHFHKEGPFSLKKKKSESNQKIPGRNSMRKLQNMIKRKMTWMKLKIFY